MDIQVLKYYVEIVECGSISAAARKLYIAQPALSIQLKSLEKELGTTLIERTAHKMEVTDAGKILYKKAKSIVALENSVKKEVRNYENGSLGMLRIGVTPSAAFKVCMDFLEDFSRRNPKVRLEVFEKSNYELVNMMENGLLDIAFMHTPFNFSSTVNKTLYSSDKMCLVYNRTYYNFDDYGKVPLNALSGRSVVYIRKYEQQIRKAFDIVLKDDENFLLPDVRLVANDVYTVIQWALCGLGVAILPYSAFISVEYESVMDFKLIDSDMLDSDIYIISQKGTLLSSTVKNFNEYLKDKVKNLNCSE